MKLVQFGSGKWAIRKYVFGLGYKYLSTTEWFWWTDIYRDRYCLFNTKEEALKGFAKAKIDRKRKEKSRVEMIKAKSITHKERVK